MDNQKLGLGTDTAQGEQVAGKKIDDIDTSSSGAVGGSVLNSKDDTGGSQIQG